MVMGEVKGTIDSQKAMSEVGLFITAIEATMPMITGIVAIEVSCEASCMLSTAEPIAAKMAE